MAKEMVEVRHQIHAYPELVFEEHATSDMVAARLKEWGYEVHRGLAGTGVVGSLKRGNGKKRFQFKRPQVCPMPANCSARCTPVVTMATPPF